MLMTHDLMILGSIHASVDIFASTEHFMDVVRYLGVETNYVMITAPNWIERPLNRLQTFSQTNLL